MSFSRPIVEVLAAAIVVALGSALFGVFLEPREEILFFGALFFGSAALLGTAIYRNRQALQLLSPRRVLLLLVVVAALLRGAALVAPLSLSDDLWRYLWDGALLLEGDNPYAHRPLELKEQGWGDELLFEKLNSPTNYTVYPPLAQGAFAAALILEGELGGAAERWLRAIFVLFDLVAVLLLGKLLLQLQRPAFWALLYAAHPLVYWEVAGGGHTEALGMVFLVCFLGFALRGRALACGLSIALAGLAKWTFLAAAPVVGLYLLRRFGFQKAFLTTLVALVVTALAYGPLYYDQLLEHHGESLRLYSETFSFNAPIYYSLRFLLGYQEGVTAPVTHITAPLLNGLTLLSIAAASLWQNGTSRRLFAGATLAFLAYILFSAVFHPWYALPLLLCAVLAGWTTPLVLGLVVVLSYAFYAPSVGQGGEAALMALQSMIVMGWAAVEFGPRLLESVLRRRALRKACLVDELIERGQRVLDLGAAEGFVGEVLAARGHEVRLVDVEDRNRTALPFEAYDGEHLLFDDDAFDVVVISYVLHHATGPDQVLKEAFRVGRRVVILETVYEQEWDRRLVTFLDHSANRLRGMAPEPLYFDTVEGWLKRIEQVGGEVSSWRWLGRGIHRHVLMDCKK